MLARHIIRIHPGKLGKRQVNTDRTLFSFRKNIFQSFFVILDRAPVIFQTIHDISVVIVGDIRLIYIGHFQKVEVFGIVLLLILGNDPFIISVRKSELKEHDTNDDIRCDN